MSDPAKMTAATKTITTFNSLWEDLRKAVFGRIYRLWSFMILVVSLPAFYKFFIHDDSL